MGFFLWAPELGTVFHKELKCNVEKLKQLNKPPLDPITSLPNRCLLLTESERSISPKNFSKITRHNVKITYAIQQQLAVSEDS